jgi:hypothetical protein
MQDSLGIIALSCFSAQAIAQNQIGVMKPTGNRRFVGIFRFGVLDDNYLGWGTEPLWVVVLLDRP